MGASGPGAGHVPVMLDRVVELLSPPLQAGPSTYVDCTLGLGGHALAMLRANPQARLVGIDRDADALAAAEERLAPVADRVTLVEAVYGDLAAVLDELGLDAVDAILADLGLSSLQIDRVDRGFSYAVDAPLDMRMTQGAGPTAADVVNTYPAAELTRILRRYGEERFADRIARRIVAERQNEPFATSARLVRTIADAVPAAARHTGGHPAKRSFQAIRIEVNRELESLEALLPAALDALAPGGRVAVLAYHSLEDRLVKNALRDASTDRGPRDMPVVPAEHQATFRLLTRGAERPSLAEELDNPRAASARLRVAERRQEVAA